MVNAYTTSLGFVMPTDYDVMFKSADPDSSAGSYFILNSRSIFTFGTDYNSGTSIEQQTVAAHELGHYFHINRNIPAMTHQNAFAALWRESMADLTYGLAYQSTTLDSPGSEPNRYLANSLSWQHHFAEPANTNFYHNSQIVSGLFWAIRSALGTVTGDDLFLDLVDNVKAISSGPGDTNFNIGDVKHTLREYIYTKLDSSQRATVCQIWTSRDFPDSPCITPNVPTWMIATNLGTCGFAWVPEEQAWGYGTHFETTWANVAREDYFDFCTSPAIFGPYSCGDIFAQDDTSTAPLIQTAIGDIVVAVRACNESGCSGLVGDIAEDTCFLGGGGG